VVSVRKSYSDFAVEAAILSKKVGRPIKVLWTREDDIKHDYYHPVSVMYIKAAIDQQGMPKAWAAAGSVSADRFELRPDGALWN